MARQHVSAYAESLDYPHLWDLLVLAEISIPSSVMLRLQDDIKQMDIIDPVMVHSPRDKDSALFRVRLHFNGRDIYESYDQCVSEGLLVVISSRYYVVKKTGTSSTGEQTFSILPSNATLSDAECLQHNPEKGAACKLSRKGLVNYSSVLCTLSLAVKQRRVQPVCFPGAFKAHRLSGEFCDVTLCVDGEDFPAHKVILAASSDVFHAMFTADFKERSAARVDIQGVSAKAFAKFLDFLYANGCLDWEDCELELLELADQYQVHRLKALCEERLWQLRGTRALAMLLRAARKPVLAPALHTRLCRQVARSEASLVDTPDWLALQKDSPFTAGFIGGILDAGGAHAPIMHQCDGLVGPSEGQGSG